jgi:hypothetical protein
MKWMRERDLLIAQTMAFVQSVTGKKPDAGMFVGVPEAAKATTITTTVVDVAAMVTETTVISGPDGPEPSQSELSKSELSNSEPVKPALPKSEPPRPIQISRTEPLDVQSEIKARVANFRAHQERFLRERDEYCSATMAKVRAALRENIEPPRSVK